VTPEDRFAELWTDYLEGDLGEAGMAELEAQLAAHSQLRERAADLFQAHRILGFALQDDAAVGESFVRATLAGLPRADETFVNNVLNRLPTPIPRPSARRFLARTLASMAAGLLVGAAVTSAAWAYAVPRNPYHSSGVVVLLDDGFESGPAPRVNGVLSETGLWGGDFTALTGQRQGVTPASGASMLQVLRADYEGKPSPVGSYCGDLHRLIDLRPYLRNLADGSAVATVSAVFNAAAFPMNEQYGCAVSLHALTAEMAKNPAAALTRDGALAMARNGRQHLDRDPLTWQRVETDLRLPADADFLLIHLAISHTPRFQKQPTFDGHFLDDVRITLAHRGPQP